MFSTDNNTFIRKETIEVSAFAKDNMQHVVCAGHFKTYQSNIARFHKDENEGYLIFYLLGGNAILVEQKEYTAIQTNSTLILNCEKDFSIFLDGCEVYYAFISGRKIAEYIKQQRLLFDLRFSKKTEIFFYSIFSSLDKYDVLDEYSMSSAILRLYSDIHIHLHEFRQRSNKQEDIQRAVNFIEENYHKSITLIDISNASGYSEYYFLRLFKEAMMMTPYEYLKRKRLAQVKVLLLSSDKTIEEIALECGFHSDISLYKAFKNTYSITPREYKKSVGK